MQILRYNGDTERYEVSFQIIKNNIVEIQGNFPAKETGFMLSRDGKEWYGDYSDYTTIYRQIDDRVQFSNDGSVWVEPEPIPEPEPYVLTYEEVLDNKINELSMQCKYIIESGLDIDGVNYSYNTEDQINFDEMNDTVSITGLPLGYHADGQDCAEYTAEQIVNISIQLKRNKYCQQTYFNQVRRYLRSLEKSDESKEIVANYVYGTPLDGEYLETYNYLIGLFDAQVVAMSIYK